MEWSVTSPLITPHIPLNQALSNVLWVFPIPFLPVCIAATLVQVFAICSWAHCGFWLPQLRLYTLTTYLPRGCQVNPSQGCDYFIMLWKLSSLHLKLNSSSLVLNTLTCLSRLISNHFSHAYPILQPSVSQPWLCSHEGSFHSLWLSN